MPACTTVESGSQIKNLKYRTLYLAAERCFRREDIRGTPQDTAVYVYAVHVNHIRYFGDDMNQAAEALVTKTDSSPRECVSGILLAKIGLFEHGGRTIAVVCNSPTESKAIPVFQGPTPLCPR